MRNQKLYVPTQIKSLTTVDFPSIDVKAVVVMCKNCMQRHGGCEKCNKTGWTFGLKACQ